MNDAIFCSKCGQDLKSITPAKNNKAILKSMAIIAKLLQEFDNPDNHSRQRNAIEDAKEFLKTV